MHYRRWPPLQQREDYHGFHRCPFLTRSERLIPRWGATTIALMSDVTQILSAMEGGDPHAPEQLLPLVYEELRRLAAQKLVGRS